MERRLDAFVALAPDGVFDPVRGDVDGAEVMQKEAATILATMGEEINLEKARPASSQTPA